MATLLDTLMSYHPALTRIWPWAGRALQAQFVLKTMPHPDIPFKKEENKHVAPDYSEEKSWAALPKKEKSNTYEVEIEEGGERISNDSRPADVFYIHPTGYFGKESSLMTVTLIPSF